MSCVSLGLHVKFKFLSLVTAMNTAIWSSHPSIHHHMWQLNRHSGYRSWLIVRPDLRLLAWEWYVEFVTSVIHDIKGWQFNRNMRVAIRRLRRRERLRRRWQGRQWRRQLIDIPTRTQTEREWSYPAWRVEHIVVGVQ